MENGMIPYEQWGRNYLDRGIIKVECHRNETIDEVEMIESYIEDA